VRPSDILSKYVGESEGRMRAVFTEAWDQACLVASKVAVVFFDEIDAIGHTRGGGEFGVGEGCSRRVLAELLLQLTELEDQVKTQRSRRGHRPLQSWQASADSPSRDHTETCCASSQPRIVVVAATNRTGDCDQALLRRFGIQLHVGLPTVEDREKLLVRLLDGVSHSLDSHQIGQLASMTQGKSGSDLESLTRAAAMAPVDECILSASDFRNSPRYGPSSASAGSSGTCESAANLDESVHDYLETLLKNLRPVCMEDFVKACGDPGCSEAGYQGA
jgi:SpoVK/Ycf46/Vps4 family AAA+-type ATPase